jgi:segregation and condensation protein B
MRETEAPIDGARLRAIVEALVFAAEEPLTLVDLQDLFPDAESRDLQAALDDVAKACEASERGLQVIRVAGGYRMTTRADLGEWVRALFRSRHRRRLSPAALETLAIVAYRQPITTPEIQAIRGTDPVGVLQNLLDKKLLRVVGRKKVVGKPILYGTTQEFLSHFGLDSLSDLPTLEEFGSLAASLSLPALSAAPARGGPFEEHEDAGPADDEEFDDATEDESEHEDDGDDS